MIRNRIASCAFALLSSTGLAAAPLSDDVSTYTWTLEREYPTQADWDADLKRVRDGIARLAAWQARPIRNSADLADMLLDMRQTRGLAGKMARFGLLMNNLDTTSDLNRQRYDTGTALEAQVEAVALPLEQKVSSLGKARVDEWSRSEPRLQSFGVKRRIERIFHEASYQPVPEARPMLAAMERWPRTTADIYESLVYQTIAWPTVQIDGKASEPLTPNSYRTIRRNADPRVRAEAARRFHDALAPYEEIMGLLFTRRLEADIARAKAQGLDDHMEASLILRDGFPAGSSRFVRAAARGNHALAERYAALVARAFGRRRGNYADVLARSPWVTNERFTVSQAIDLITRSQRSLGAEYQREVPRQFQRKLLYLAPAQNKTGMVGNFIQVGGGVPYGMANFDGSLDTARALAMVMQSVMQDVTMPQDGWPDRREDDQPIFGNSRWTLGQLLFDDQRYREASTAQARAAALLDMLSRLWTEYFYRGAMVELESWATERVRTGSPPTGKEISAKYLALMRELNGTDGGGLAIDDVYGREWMTEGTIFFGNHQLGFVEAYVATVATGEAIARGDRNVIDSFTKLRGRDAEYSYELLRRSGIDMASNAPFDAYARFMTAKMDQLEAELAAMRL